MVRFSVLAFLIFQTLLLGCSKKNADPVRGFLSGKVTLKGAPLTGGNVLFHKDGKEVGNATLNTDGTFELALPIGELKVGVETETLKMELGKVEGKGPGLIDPKVMMKYQDKKLSPEEIMKIMTDPSNRPKYVPVPEKYRNPEQSGLTVTIQAGKQEKDFPIP